MFFDIIPEKIRVKPIKLTFVSARNQKKISVLSLQSAIINEGYLSENGNTYIRNTAAVHGD